MADQLLSTMACNQELPGRHAATTPARRSIGIGGNVNDGSPGRCNIQGSYEIYGPVRYTTGHSGLFYEIVAGGELFFSGAPVGCDAVARVNR